MLESMRDVAGPHDAAILGAMPLLWRVFLINASVMGAGALALLVTPATVSSPAAGSQVAVVAVGLVLVLALDLALLRPYVLPLQELAQAMARVDLLQPGARVGGRSQTPEVQVVSTSFNRMLGRLEDERRRSAQSALAAQEHERLRVSRELHDGVGQRLTGVLLRLQSMEAQIPEAVRGDVARLRDEVRASLQEVRATVRRLRPEALDDLGLASALVALVQDVGRSAPLVIDRRFEGRLDDLGEPLELAVYRIAQEALTNTVRHAGAGRVELTLVREGGTLVLRIADDGRGFDPGTTPSGAGLTGMRERALLVDGRLTVRSEPGAGTTIALEAPGP
jgi:two-component system sensor histidine kinase UhpB